MFSPRLSFARRAPSERASNAPDSSVEPIGRRDSSPWAGTTDELRVVAEAARRGEPQAIETLLLSVAGGMLTTVRKVLGWNHQDVEDVTQEATLAFLDALDSYRGEGRVAAFAQRIAFLTALSERRHRAALKRQTPASHDETLAPARLGATPEYELLAQQRRALLQRVLDELPDVIASALGQHFILGLTVEEIAEAEAVSPNTIWSRLRLGKAALRKQLTISQLDLREGTS